MPRPGLVGEHAHQDQVVLLAVLLGHTALLVDREFLLVAARIAVVACDTGGGPERAVVGPETLASQGKHLATKSDEMGKQYAYSATN